jgi:hypothetical protein
MLEPGFQLPQQELLDLLASRLDFKAVFPATPRACWMDDASAVTTAGLALQLAKVSWARLHCPCQQFEFIIALASF